MEYLSVIVAVFIVLAGWLVTVGIYRQKISGMETKINSLESFDSVTNREYHELNGDIKVLTSKIDTTLSLLQAHDKSSVDFREETLQRIAYVESKTNGKPS